MSFNPDELNALFGLTATSSKLASECLDAAAEVTLAAFDDTDPEAEIIAKIKGKVVTLTGRPVGTDGKANGMTKNLIAAILKRDFKAKDVINVFTKQTQVVIFNPEQDTAKARKAAQAGLITVPYTDLSLG